MAQGFIVAHAHGGGGDGLHVQHPHRPEIQGDIEVLLHQLANDLQLDAAHDPQVDAPGGLVHHHRQGRVLLLQLPQRGQHLVRGHRGVPQCGGGHHRLGVEAVVAAAMADHVPGAHPGEPRRGAEQSGFGSLERGELCAAVKAQLIHPARATGQGKFLPGLQGPGHHLEETHTAALGVVAHLVAEGAEGGAVF